MTYTPGEIRAAEEMLDHISKIVGFLTPFQEAAKVAAEAILRHRSDYDVEGMPLPLDDSFCIEMGAEPYDQPDNLTCLVWEDDRGWLISKGVFGQWYIYGNELPETAWPATRPQLRALIEVMG